jgi:predicted nuclease of restriction endonuclease-like (RecB) superfamily
MDLIKEFSQVVHLIQKARVHAVKTANKQLIDLYWEIGEYISHRVQAEKWGKSVVQELAAHISRSEPEIKGFSDKNLWRMKQFYEAYAALPKLSPMVRQISWTNNTIILTGAKSTEEKEFYLRLCIQEGYGKRELERQLESSVYEWIMPGKQKLSRNDVPNSSALIKTSI